MPVSCCTNPRKTKTTKYDYSSTCTCSYGSKTIRYSTGKIKSNPLEPHSNFSDDVSVLKRARKLLSLCHTVVRVPMSPSPRGRIWIDGVAIRVMAEFGNVVQEKYRGRGASSREIVQKIVVLLWAMQHRCTARLRLRACA